MPPEYLGDDAVVVRGGQSRDVDAHVQKINDAAEDWGIPALSVYIVERGSSTFDAALMEACICGDIPHGKVQVARLGDLRAAGFEPVLDTSDGQPDCHYNVIFGNEVQPEDAERFIRCFDEPMANPTGGRKRRTS